MLKSKTHKVGALVMASVITMGGAMASSSAVHASAPADGKTPVSYENRTVLPDGNAKYGVIIPTAITFSDDDKTADASIEIAGINGFDLDKNWSVLRVETSIKSDNGYKLKDGAKEVEYKVEVESFDSTALSGADLTGVNAITEKLGVGGTSKKKLSGNATLTGDATAKGQYKDTLTYSFVEEESIAK